MTSSMVGSNKALDGIPIRLTERAWRCGRSFDLVCERPLLLHEGLGEGEIRPPFNPTELPPRLREVFERGQQAGIFRADSDFEPVQGEQRVAQGAGHDQPADAAGVLTSSATRLNTRTRGRRLLDR
ncbi:hypothetical protein [Streptosporangium sp. KLBMP 9127]|nr:hypothetical protein [Streptosporangium sp. KLBMP 9127]